MSKKQRISTRKNDQRVVQDTRRKFTPHPAISICHEVSYQEMIPTLDGLIDTPLVNAISDGSYISQRQFVSIDACATCYQGKYGLSDAEMDNLLETKTRPNHL